MKVYVNGEPREVGEGASVAEVVAPGEPATPRGIAVAVDGSVVPRAQHSATTVHEGARIEIVTAVQGG
ncbi:sulfur carrier protein ThiS [Microlunatus ginsengisoli]|uniref:Sulfur carrier protein ThiS n=1 Tax=Microlunatus ginsengisoli TaxID=363863 RepID=A0ABP7ABN0_9ACTN